MPQIRLFNWRRHARDVIEFQREIYETNFPGFVADPGFLRDYGQQLRKALGSPSEGLYVLEEDGQTCGFLWLSLISTMVDPCIGYIKNIFVSQDLRGQGQGRGLLSFAEDWCRQRGVTRISLDASCCNEHAVSLYERSGFDAVRIRMEKSLIVDAGEEDGSGIENELEGRPGSIYD